MWEIVVLLVKDVMKPVPPADMKAGFFSSYIIVRKKSGGLRQILSLRILNWAFHKLPFKMLTQKCIFGCICLRDWSAAVDQKDLYFHLSILLHHRPFLRVAFEGRALPLQVCISPSEPSRTDTVQIREDENQILLVAPCWPTLTWFPELRLLVISPLQQIPLR